MTKSFRNSRKHFGHSWQSRPKRSQWAIGSSRMSNEGQYLLVCHLALLLPTRLNLSCVLSPCRTPAIGV